MHTVRRAVREQRDGFRPQHAALGATSSIPPGPSSDLMVSLLSLNNSLCQFGVSQDPRGRREVVQATLRLYVKEMLGDGWKASGLQALYDIALLRKLSTMQDCSWPDVDQLCEVKLNEHVGGFKPMCCSALMLHQLPAEDSSNLSLSDLESTASAILTRSQTLFSALLPLPPDPPSSADPVGKGSCLLPHGLPSLDQQFQPAFDLAKPTARFGLLLVGSTTRNSIR